MTSVIVYSFRGYDTAKHRPILRAEKATLERIRRIDDAVAVAGSSDELHRPRWLTVMGFGAQALNEGRDADGPALTAQSRLVPGPAVTGADVAVRSGLSPPRR
jgi:hypothetical protein